MLSGLGVHPKAAHFNAFYLSALIYQIQKRPWCWFKCRHYQRRESIWFMKEKKTTSELKNLMQKSRKKIQWSRLMRWKMIPWTQKLEVEREITLKSNVSTRYILYPLYCTSNWKCTRNKTKTIGCTCVYIAATLHQHPYYTKQKQPLWDLDKSRKKEKHFHKSDRAQNNSSATFLCFLFF